MEFPGVIKENNHAEFPWGLSLCLALTIPMGVTQFCGISRGEASFCLDFLRVK